uniref:Protein rhodnius neglectus n=2 Tax=Rhodnius TaxID=13248 RepID=A0A4P6DA92_RHOPR
MLIGSCSRYIVGGKAVQTVYWRAQPSAANGQTINRIIKTKKTVSFPTSDHPRPNITTTIRQIHNISKHA